MHSLSLSLLLSRALFAAGANGFSNRSLKSALLSSSPSLSPAAAAAAVGRDQPPILFTHLLELPLSLLAARCSLLGCAAASSLLVCWCLRRFYRRRSAFHCLNLCALAPALSRSLSLPPSPSPSPSLYLFLSFCGFRCEFVLISGECKAISNAPSNGSTRTRSRSRTRTGLRRLRLDSMTNCRNTRLRLTTIISDDDLSVALAATIIGSHAPTSLLFARLRLRWRQRR